jgi:hypothetical protein
VNRLSASESEHLRFGAARECSLERVGSGHPPLRLVLLEYFSFGMIADDFNVNESPEIKSLRAEGSYVGHGERMGIGLMELSMVDIDCLSSRRRS